MSLRWAFNCAQWNPTLEQFAIGLNTVQDEERKRICSFVYKKDVKTALIGRLLIRKAVREITGLQNAQINLARTDRGRPYLKNYPNNFNNSNISNDCALFDFNISHDTDMVVLACEDGAVGVDTMEVSRPVGSGSIGRFFELMERQFHANEWTYIRAGNTQDEQLQRFYRLWCMKESFVKVLGVGIGFNLDRVECCIQQELNPVNCHYKGETEEENGVQSYPNHVLMSSSIKVDGDLKGEYSFEESLLLGRFITCVAVHSKQPNSSHEDAVVQYAFGMVTFDNLIEMELKDVKNLGKIKDKFANDFKTYVSKDCRPV